MFTTVRAALVAIAFVVAGTAGQVEAAAPRYDLFYNYYQSGSIMGGVPAQMYLSPRPVPPLVGHTYITYQPLMPHEFLYRHDRTYRRYNSPRALIPSNVTRVSWW